MKISNVAAIIAVSALSAVASAQGRPPMGGPGGGMGRGGGGMMGGGRDPKQVADMQTKFMTEMLGLNPAQAAKVKAIVLKSAIETKKIRDAQTAALKKVLTTDQIKKMESMRGGGRGPGGGGMGRGGRPPGR